MKKKIFGGIAVLAIAAVTVINVNLGMKDNGNFSLLSLANVEALANGDVNNNQAYEEFGPSSCQDINVVLKEDYCFGARRISSTTATYICNPRANAGDCEYGRVVYTYYCNQDTQRLYEDSRKQDKCKK